MFKTARAALTATLLVLAGGAQAATIDVGPRTGEFTGFTLDSSSQRRQTPL